MGASNHVDIALARYFAEDDPVLPNRFAVESRNDNDPFDDFFVEIADASKADLLFRVPMFVDEIEGNASSEGAESIDFFSSALEFGTKTVSDARSHSRAAAGRDEILVAPESAPPIDAAPAESRGEPAADEGKEDGAGE